MSRLTQSKEPFFSAFTINIIFIVLVIMGLSFVRYLPVKLNPGRKLPELSVRFSYFGATPEVVEKQVTSKLEGVFETIKGIETIESNSGNGWGSISLQLDNEANPEMVRYETLLLVRQVFPQLPQGVTYPLVTQAGANDDSPVQLLTYTINGNAESNILFQYLNDFIQPRIALIDGVQNIALYGSTPNHWEIKYKTKRINELGITKDDISNAIQQYFNQVDLGKCIFPDPVSNNELLLTTRFIGHSTDSSELSKIPVKEVSDRIIYLEQIADITHKQKQEESYFRINGLNAINMVVYATPLSNQISLAAKVKADMKQISLNLPPGYSITLAFDSSTYLKKEIQKTFWRTIASTVILLLFVLIISRSFRYLSVITISLVANLCIAVFFYYWLKIEIHLYSLAGITVSLGIIIDNSIIMTDHLRHHKNKRVFLAVLAATLTTIGALVVIFFLEKSQQVNLIDFAWVIIINLAVSLLVALFFIPALIEKIPLQIKRGVLFYKRKKNVIRFNLLYRRFIGFCVKYKLAVILIGILAFGIPLFLLPDKLEGDLWYSVAYNKSIGSETYKEKIKPTADKLLGGTFRLFVEFVREENYFSTPERTSLNVKVKLPQGASLQNLNHIYTEFENYLSQFNEIDFFQTTIDNIENSGLVIYFKKEFDSGSFPYLLKGRLESKAIEISSADFTIYGVGRGFNNALSHGFKGSRMIFTGYNYNELLSIARDAKARFLKNPRISEVFIESGKAWWFYDIQNIYLAIDKKMLAQQETSFLELVNQLGRFNLREDIIYNLPYNGSFEELSLVSDYADKYDRWDMDELATGTKHNIKLKDIALRYNENASKTIYRENQEYVLTVAYDFIGPDELARMVLEEYEKEISAKLPVGYKAEIFKYAGWWNVKEKNQYLLLLVMIIIIYFICSILLESFVQPLLVISMIPLSFIGIFLTFYFTGVKFDQGGYASFLLVSGLVVNAALYILNDMNAICQNKPIVSRINNYIRAYNSKIIPILLTIASTVLGLVPFIFWGRNEPFWFALSVGTIGGLLFSIPITVVFLPIMIKNKSTNVK